MLEGQDSVTLQFHFLTVVQQNQVYFRVKLPSYIFLILISKINIGIIKWYGNVRINLFNRILISTLT